MIIYKYNKVIGELDPVKKTFTKKMKGSKHIFKKADAWGIDADTYRKTLLPLNYLIEITDTESGVVYSARAEVFDKKGEFLHFKGTEDYGAQIFLSRTYWEKTEPVKIKYTPDPNDKSKVIMNLC